MENVILILLFILGLATEAVLFFGDVKNDTKNTIKFSPCVWIGCLVSFAIKRTYYALAFATGTVVVFLAIPVVAVILSLIQFVWDRVDSKK